MTLLIAIALAASGCATLAKAPYVGWVFKRKPTYYTYIGDPHFTFEYPRKWKDGIRIPGGVEFRSPDSGTRASFSVAYSAEGDRGYKPLDAYRRDMIGWGAVEDEHRLYAVAVSSRAAYRVRFTTYEYPPEYLLGEKVDVLYTEVLAIPDPAGVFIIRYRSDKSDFWRKRYRVPYEYFLKTLQLITITKGN